MLGRVDQGFVDINVKTRQLAPSVVAGQCLPSEAERSVRWISPSSQNDPERQSQSLSRGAVVVGHRPAPARLQRQPGLGAVERLDLALFVQPQHDRVRRRFHIEADDVGELGFVRARNGADITVSAPLC
jgi:hypothetical protein